MMAYLILFVDTLKTLREKIEGNKNLSDAIVIFLVGLTTLLFVVHLYDEIMMIISIITMIMTAIVSCGTTIILYKNKSKK